LAVGLLGAVGLTGCSAEETETPQQDASSPIGWLLTNTNGMTKNEVTVLQRFSDGTMQRSDSVETGGSGTGRTLANSGAIATSPDGSTVYTVHAGRNTLSAMSFDPKSGRLSFIDTVGSGGAGPSNVTTNGDTLFALSSAIGADLRAKDPHVVGFSIQSATRLKRIKTSTQDLLPIWLRPLGETLLVSGWEGSQLATIAVDPDGKTAVPEATDAAENGPFGFDFRSDGVVMVSDDDPNARDGAPTHTLGPKAKVIPITATVASGGDGSCWAAFGVDGASEYIVNFDTDSITPLSIDTQAVIRETGTPVELPKKSEPRDLAVSNAGDYLYVLGYGFGQVLAFDLDETSGIERNATVKELSSKSTGLLLIDN
jgi:6-phosphogluconolactonase (cycloisomerase 2 family)